MEEPFLLFGPAEADGAIRLAPWRYFIDSSITFKAMERGWKIILFPKQEKIRRFNQRIFKRFPSKADFN
jgi:hypothetical protein